MARYVKSQRSELAIDDSKDAIIPQVRFIECPIRTSLGVLGKKWTMLILRDIGFLKIVRFNRILESISGLTPRVLSMRLRELEDEGFIECVGGKKKPLIVIWRLTEKQGYSSYLDAVDSLWFKMACRCSF